MDGTIGDFVGLFQSVFGLFLCVLTIKKRVMPAQAGIQHPKGVQRPDGL